MLTTLRTHADTPPPQVASGPLRISTRLVTPPPPEPRARLRTRVMRWLDHPLRMTVLIPALVVVTGGVLIALSRASLDGESAQHWRDRLGDEAAVVAASAARGLGQAQPLLGAVAEAVRAQASDALAVTLGGLQRGRSGVAALTVVAPDGGGLRAGQERQPVRFAADGPAAEGLGAEQRALVERARRGEAPVWSAPYLAASGAQTLSCAQSFALPGGRAVALVDFDAPALDDLVGGAIAHDDGAKPFLFTADGTMLVRRRAPREQGSAPRAGARSFAEVLGDLPAAGAVRFFDHSVNGLPVYAAVRRVALADGPVLYASAVAPISALAASTRLLVVRSLWVEVASVLAAVAVAWLLARAMTRQRREVQRAQAAAAAARVRLDALGSYTLVRRLTSGGMGEIWQAEHQLLARPAALKLISVEGMGGTDRERDVARQRFAREARATASLSSPHTITIYDFGFTRDGSFYYAMELLDGLDLERLVAGHGAQHPARVVRILTQVCRSLAEAHAHGLVHRDIKPANIHLCRLGLEVDVAKVLDFGLVAERTRIDRRSASDTVLGTPGYMAPEQAQGFGADARSDLYALGAVAYWLLAGRPLFDEQDAQRLLGLQITTKPAPLARAARQPIPAALTALVESLLAKDPERRPRDAQAVITALEAIPDDPDEGWPEGRARAWWAMHRPVRSADPTPSGLRTVTLRVATP